MKKAKAHKTHKTLPIGPEYRKKLFERYLDLDYRLTRTIEKFIEIAPQYGRYVWFDHYIHSAEDAARLVWLNLAAGNRPLGLHECLLLDLPDGSTSINLANLIVEIANEHGWTARLQELLAKNVKAVAAKRQTDADERAMNADTLCKLYGSTQSASTEHVNP